MPVGLYIHVPFCRTRCDFCAFYLRRYREGEARLYVEALAREIKLYAALNVLSGRPLHTVYFGGGTPTMLPPEQLTRILDLIRDRFGLEHHAEVTVEAHPDTVSENGLQHLARGGVTRISFGAQSFESEELIQIGRRSVPDCVRRAVALARTVGFENINLDLMYGLPGQTLGSWIATLNGALDLSPTHLSCYALTVEEGTKLQRDITRGHTVKPDSELQIAMEEAALERLTAAGFTRYEIANFCRPGFACRHNLLYWRDEDYLGVGPSAQSYIHGRRFGNVEDLAAYCERLEQGILPVEEVDELSPRQRMREAVIFGLRLVEGIDLNIIRTRSGMDTADPEWELTVERLVQEGLLSKQGHRLQLTEAGRRFADSVAVALL